MDRSVLTAWSVNNNSDGVYITLYSLNVPVLKILWQISQHIFSHWELTWNWSKADLLYLSWRKLCRLKIQLLVFCHIVNVIVKLYTTNYRLGVSITGSLSR